MGFALATDGAIYQCVDGEFWLVCRRKMPHQPAQSANIDTGELRVFEDSHVAQWCPVKLSAVVRLIGPHTSDV